MTHVIFLVFLSLNLGAFELKVGDVLLQPLSCWSCSLIEAQEKSIYSHMGVVIENDPEVLVAEALGEVRVVSLKEFQSKTEKGEFLSVRRLRRSDAVFFLQERKAEFLDHFREYFWGLKYDHDFLWNNVDENGLEKMYCSEMVSKLFLGFLKIEIPLKTMKFDVNREEWIKYFKSLPPDGKRGNSPATFEHSELFFEVGKL